MMRWLMALVVVAGCQTTDTTERTLALSEDPCQAKLPPAPVWDGKFLAPPGPTELQLVVPSPFTQGEMLATRVDYATGKITSALRVTAKQTGPFYYIAGKYGRLVVPGTPPQPPEVTPRWIVFAALRYADVPQEALADAKSCSVQ